MIVRPSAVCEFVVAMAMSNMGYLFIHSLSVTYKRDSDRAYFHLFAFFILLMNQPKKKTFGNSYWFAKGCVCMCVCVCVCVIQQRAQMCEWNQLRSRASEAAVVSFTFWALLHGWWVWLGDRPKRARTLWPASNENPPFWSFSGVTVRRSGHRSSEVTYFLELCCNMENVM